MILFIQYDAELLNQMPLGISSVLCQYKDMVITRLPHCLVSLMVRGLDKLICLN